MDGSLASIFMDGSLPLLPVPWTSTGENTEELQFELARASMELESAKAEALAQDKLQEARLWRLHELLNATRIERDKARQECQKLQERLRQASSISPADSPRSFFHSITSSPSSCVPSSPDLLSDLQSWSFHDMPSQSPPTISIPPSAMEETDLHRAALVPVPLTQDADDLQALFALDSNKDPIVTSDSSQQFSMDVLDEDLLLDQDQSLDLAELQEESFPTVLEAKPSNSPSTGRTLSRQSSSNSSSASLPQQLRTVIGSSEVSAPISSHIPAVCSPSDTFTMTPISKAYSPSLLSTPVASMVRLVNSSPRTAYPLTRLHLPEPPESDPQVMLGSLPEKGKLLQAVLQAGPLLQTLLLAGPLPQWRYPPPALSTFEIPKVSMSSNSGLFPFITPAPAFVPNPTQIFASGYGLSPPVSLVPAPVYVRGGTAVRSESSLADNRTPSPCSRSRKLRKLSSAVLHGDQMMSGGVKLAAGAANFATTW